jgi:hypothetical protein
VSCGFRGFSYTIPDECLPTAVGERARAHVDFFSCVPRIVVCEALRPLPAERYEFAIWKKGEINIDYHIDLRCDRHYYSVPFQLVGEVLEVRITAKTVEISPRHRRVTFHVRSYVRGGYTTVPAHMPEAHRRHAQWTPSCIVGWAKKTAPATASLVSETAPAVCQRRLVTVPSRLAAHQPRTEPNRWCRRRRTGLGRWPRSCLRLAGDIVYDGKWGSRIDGAHQTCRIAPIFQDVYPGNRYE